MQLAIKDRNPNIRIVGLRLARQLKFDIPPIVAKLVNDPNPMVRRECAISIRHNSSPEAAKLWARLAVQHDGKDRWYLEALGIGADKQWDRFFQAYLDSKREHIEPVSKPFADIVWRSRSAKALPYLAELILATNNQEDRLRYFRGFDFHTGPEKNEVLAKLITGRHKDQSAINAVAFGHLSGIDVNSNEDLKAAMKQTLDSLKGTSRFVELVKQFNIRDYNEELLSVALNNPTNGLGVEAIRCLIRFKEFDLIKKTLYSKETKNPEKLTGLLGMANDRQANGLLADIAGDQSLGLPLRNEAVAGLGKNGSGEKMILSLVEKDKLPQALHFVAANILFSSRDKKLKERAAEFLAMPKNFKGETLLPIKELVRKRGNAEKGKMVFLRSCMTCHKIEGIGIEFGPSIEQIGGKLARETLYRTILDPSAAISFGYEGFIITLKDGNKAVGYVTSETDDNLSLRVVGGLTLDYKKSDIVSKTALSQSLMTANLQMTMSSDDLVDLVEYLTTLK
ncbi:MAG: c-type cytochrome [Planctomycetes bacterium]|nr:c-type cytochrome [Planctomycetota bacterium]